MRPVRLLIVDDHRVFAEGLEAVFRAEPDFEPMPAVTNPDHVVSMVAAQKPDAVVMDVQLGDVSGIELTSQLTALPNPPVVVVLTAFSDAATAIGAVQAGAMGFVSKNGPAQHVVTAVRAAMLGGTWFPSGLLTVMLAASESDVSEPLGQLFAELTDKEREVLRLMVSGLDRRSIADRLQRSPDTVKTHIRNIAAKLGTRSTAEAVAMALNAGVRPELTRNRVPGVAPPKVSSTTTRASCPGRARPGARSRSALAAHRG